MKKKFIKLNEEGILTVRGKVFTNSHVHSILKKKNIREERLHREPKKEISKFKLDPVWQELVSDGV